MPKKTERGTLWDFLTSILSQNIKECRRTLWGKFFLKKNLAVPKKKMKGGPGMVCYTEKQEKTFLVQFARPNSAIWCNNIL